MSAPLLAGQAGPAGTANERHASQVRAATPSEGPKENTLGGLTGPKFLAHSRPLLRIYLWKQATCWQVRLNLVVYLGIRKGIFLQKGEEP